MPGAVRIGTSGWSYASWRDALYGGVPQRRWLERYAEIFDSVELNNSFYRLPSAEQFAVWKARTPPGFAFAVKGSRVVTHQKRLIGVEAQVTRFFAAVRGLGRKAAVTLWQLPPRLECEPERLEAFLALLPRGRTRRQAIEFRHPSWYARDVYALLERRGVALVLPDSAADPAMHARELVDTTDFTYVRLHYGRGRGGSYSEGQLRTWAKRVARWRRNGDVYVYFNNDWEGFAVRNAVTLKSLLAAPHSHCS